MRQSSAAGVKKPVRSVRAGRKVPSDDPCYSQAGSFRDKTSRSSIIQFMYTGINEEYKAHSSASIGSRQKLALIVNSFYSFRGIHVEQGGASLDIVFVPRDRSAAAVRFPPVPPEQLSQVEETAPDGTAWSFAVRHAAAVLLTQNEFAVPQKWRHEPQSPASDADTMSNFSGALE